MDADTKLLTTDDFVKLLRLHRQAVSRLSTLDKLLYNPKAPAGAKVTKAHREYRYADDRFRDFVGHLEAIVFGKAKVVDLIAKDRTRTDEQRKTTARKKAEAKASREAERQRATDEAHQRMVHSGNSTSARFSARDVNPMFGPGPGGHKYDPSQYKQTTITIHDGKRRPVLLGLEKDIEEDRLQYFDPTTHKAIECPKCQGSRWVPKIVSGVRGRTTCPKCDGFGSVIVPLKPRFKVEPRTKKAENTLAKEISREAVAAGDNKKRKRPQFTISKHTAHKLMGVK